MTSVSHFAQYLLKQDPQRNTARLTLYNFLKHVLEPGLPFSPIVIETFYARVLQFDNWRNEAKFLSDTVRADIEGFLKLIGAQDDKEVWQNLRHSDTLQAVPLRMFQDLEELVAVEHEARQKSGHEIKTISIGDNQILALVLAPTGSLEVKVFPALALVQGARLRLPAPTTQLFYGADFELMPNVRQVLEGSLLTTHCFHTDIEGVHGLVTRGHTFQKFETFIRAKLSETQDLFASLKRVERHFINPQTDPHYQEIVSRLERANRLVGSGSSSHLDEAERMLNRGRMALKSIFPNDRLLSLLVTHLEYGINQRRDFSQTEQIPR